jgi:MYXO-CTERM domain-containing protein
VLSACETGLGDVSAGEGVYGLRRAFAIAGAQTVLMSLWEVDDDATRDLMVGFYLRMAAKEGRAEALRTTQLSLLYDKKHAHPFFWAAFLAAGDPRPVDFAVAPPGGIPKAGVPGKTGCACTMVGQEQPAPIWVGLLVAGLLARNWRRRSMISEP